MNHTIPTSLVRYQQALEEAIRRDVAGAPTRRRRRRLRIRLLLAGSATAAVGLGVLGLLVAGAPPAVAPAAAAIIRHAEAALSQTPGTILHIAFTGTQDNGNGTTVSWSQESFTELSPPYDSRQINQQLPGTPPGVEQATVNGVSQVYDPTRNTIYTGPAPSNPASLRFNRNGPHYRFRPGPTPGTYRVRERLGFLFASGKPKPRPVAHVRTIYRTVVVTAAQAKALREGKDYIRWTYHSEPLRVTNPRIVRTPGPSEGPSDVDPFSATFRGQILALLRSGHARVLGHATIDGRDTIEIRSADGHITYYVAPDSYAPVELTTRGTTGGTQLRFRAYEEIQPSQNSQLLSLTAQHPTAKIDRKVADYDAAEARLFPHG